MKRKCELLGFTKSTLYYKPQTVNNDDIDIMQEISEIYAKNQSYGYRKMEIELRKNGRIINHKKVRRLYEATGLKTQYPKKITTINNPEHRVYPYLLKGMTIDRPNQVWQVDITYIKIRTGFVYLICLIDVFSRRIMGWILSTSLETQPCLDALINALKIALNQKLLIVIRVVNLQVQYGLIL